MRKTFFAALVILIIAVFFRFYNLGSLPPGLYPDEAMNGSNALEAIKNNDFKVFYPENNGREGLFINIQAMAVRIFGNEAWALRSVSAAFGALTVLGIFFLARELMKKKEEEEVLIMGLGKAERIAFFAALFAAVALWPVLFSRIGFRANMAPFSLAWSLYFLVRSLPLIKEKLLKAMPLLIGGGLLFGLGMHSYIAYRATPIVIAVIFFAKLVPAIKERYSLKLISAFVAFTAASVLVFAPLAFYFIENPADFMGRTTQVSVFSSGSPLATLALNTAKTLGMFNIVGDFNWRHNYSGDPILSPVVGMMFIAGIALSIAMIMKSFRKGREDDPLPAVILLTTFTVALLPVITSSEGIPHALRAILAVPPVFIFAGMGAEWLFAGIGKWIGKDRRSTIILKSSLITFIVFIVIEGYVLYFIRWGGNENVPGAFAQNFVETAERINSLPISQKKYILVRGNGVDVRGWPMPTQTVMFLTDTFLPESRPEKNIVYIKDVSEIPPEEKGYALFVID